MFKIARVLSLIVETPLHAGSGNDLGIVDLPIQRERHTGYPKIEASGLKGSLREIFEAQGKNGKNLPEALTQAFPAITRDNYQSDGIDLTFGPDSGDLHAGSLGFSDARLLLFPVKSMKGVFAWITCPVILERFVNDWHLTRQTLPAELSAVNAIQGELRQQDIEAVAPKDSNLIVRDGRIILEEYTFLSTSSENATKLATWLADNLLPGGDEYMFWREKMKTDIVILPDNDFRDFVTLSTEVIARTNIDHKTGTVNKKIGGLWYEEYLPADSLLYALALASPVFGPRFRLSDPVIEHMQNSGIPEGIGQRLKAIKDRQSGFASAKEFKNALAKKLDKQEIEKHGKELARCAEIFPDEEKVMAFFGKGLPQVVQIGGNATLGKGLVRTKLLGNSGSEGGQNNDNN